MASENPLENRIKPVGKGDYRVQQGDCISSIAADHGHSWETLWNLPANAELKAVGRDPNILLPGDRVTIPPVRPKHEALPTDQRTLFCRLGEPTFLQIQFKVDGQPRTSEAFRVEFQAGARSGGNPKTEDSVGNGNQRGKVIRGQLDAQGLLKISIPGNTRGVRVTLGEKSNECVLFVALGAVDPIEDLCGVQERLFNLGYCSRLDGDRIDEELRAALQQFQREHELRDSGEADSVTCQALVKEHGS